MVILLWFALLFSSSYASDPQFNPLGAQLSGKRCEVYRDPQGISHVRASFPDSRNRPEILAFACLGWVHGSERSWEMDYFRRIVRGRKAEILGKDYIQSDFLMRLLGLDEKADQLFEKLDQRYKDDLWAYSWGVNRGFQKALKQGVYEFRQLGYQPEPWHPEDSLALLLLEAFDQTRRSFQIQFTEKSWMNQFGQAAAHLYQREGTPWNTTILKEGEYLKTQSSPSNPAAAIPAGGFSKSGESENELHFSQGIQSFFAQIAALPASPGMGSNNWVVGPSRSKTENAWLANDPHLELTRPPFWHWIHLNSGEIDVIGATLPGIPIFPSATNRHLSWGLTDSFLPVARVSFVPIQDLVQSKSVRPWIWVRVLNTKVPFFFKTFQRTHSNLPVLPLPAPAGKAAVLRWTGYDLEPKDISGLMDLEYARSVSEADTVFSRIRVPSWNFVFADDQGHIGYRAIGRTPRFEKEPPLGIPQESLAKVENSPAFLHPLTPEEMPHLIDPKRGYIATANNMQWPSDSFFSVGRAQAQSFRAFRIEELLNRVKLHDLNSNQAIQCDVQAVDARFLVPEMVKVLESDGIRTLLKKSDQTAIQTLKEWNFQTDLSCTACGLFRRWVDHLYDEKELTSVSLYRSLREEPTLDFKKEVLRAFEKSLEDMNYDRNTGQLPAWGSIHKNFFHHLAGRSWFEVNPIVTPGDENTVNPGSSSWREHFFDHHAGASQRLVVEMSTPPKVYSVLAGFNQDNQPQPDIGASGSEWMSWRNCELRKQEFPLNWSKVKDQLQIVTL